MRSISVFCFILVLLVLAPLDAQSEVNSGAPIFRGRVGMSMTNFSVGSLYDAEPLGSMVTVAPTVLWDLPTFRARVGFHYLGEFSSKYGAAPISGIGISSYFYPFGLSTAYEIGQDATLIQKSKPGPYAYITVTPVNFNINAGADASPTRAPVAFSAFMIDLGFGAGYDYPLTTNMVLSIEGQYRVASAQERNSSEALSYSGMGVMLVFSTSYH